LRGDCVAYLNECGVLTVDGFEKMVSTLLPISIRSDFCYELEQVFVLAKLQDYEVVIKADSKNLINISFIGEKDKYTMSLNSMNGEVAILYIFSINTIFKINSVPKGVNVNDVRTMISSIDKEGMIECLRLFKLFL
jgi:hypothetical protein